MKWEPINEIEGCGVLSYERYEDDRGYFEELYNHQAFAAAKEQFPWSWAQDNISYSHAGVLRGFHLQRNNPQGKLITCLVGRIMDVCLDLRRNSPTFLKMIRIVLDGSDPKSFWLPPGTAHAFIALSDTMIHYRCTTAYDKKSDGGVNATSPELEMVWPQGACFRSDKDKALPNLMDYLETIT